MKMATISTHVLDTARGLPAKGVRVALYDVRDGAQVAHGITDADGRVRFEGEFPVGHYDLDLDFEHYPQPREHLFESVMLQVHLRESRHYHVPVLLSPFGITSYRGS